MVYFFRERQDILRVANKIKDCIESGNYRSLKHFLLNFSAVNLSFLHQVNKTFSLQLLAVRAWIEAERLGEDSKVAYEKRMIVCLLVAYGMHDLKVTAYYRSYQEQHCVNSLFWGGRYLDERTGFLNAVKELLATFQDEKKIAGFYAAIAQLVEKNPAAATIKLIYQQKKEQLKVVNSFNYWDGVTGTLSVSPINETAKANFFPFLSECSCRFFDRAASQRRHHLMNQIISETKVRLLPSETRLVYLGLGFGSGLQDFILLHRLIRLKYSSMKVVLIDPDSAINVIRQMKELYHWASQQGVRFEMEFYDSIQEYELSDNFESPNLICSIDFNNIFAFEGFNDLMYTHRLMAAEGYYYLSFSEFDLCLDARTCRDYRIHTTEKEVMAIPKEHFAQLAPFETLSYVSLGVKYNFQEWLELLPIFNHSKCKNAIITLVKPRRLNFYGDLTSQIQHDFNADNLNYFFKLLIPEISSIKVILISSLQTFTRHMSTHRNSFDIVTLIDYEVTEKKAQMVANWFNNLMKESHYFYRLVVKTYENFEEKNRLYEYLNRREPSATLAHK